VWRLRVLELADCLAVRELRVAAPALESLTFYGRVLDGGDDDGWLRRPRRLRRRRHAGPAGRVPVAPRLRLQRRPKLRGLPLLVQHYNAVAHARILTTCSVGLLVPNKITTLTSKFGNSVVCTEYSRLTITVDQLLHHAYIYGETEHKHAEPRGAAADGGQDQDLEYLSTFFTVTSPPVLRRLFVRVM
jgi:hypothetical protein